MKLAYADPPYIGMAKKHYSYDPQHAEVDHAELIARLDRDYDGWALSCSEQTLHAVLAMCPAGVRIGAWVKEFVAYKSCNPSYAWEPVVYRQARKRKRPKVRSWVRANMTMQTGTPGAKPAAFCFWVFEMLNAERGDSLDDLYPGSGAVGKCWEQFCRQMVLIDA